MQGEIRNDRDLIAAQANIAETREERERLEMRLLDYAHEEERLALEAVKASRERLLGTQASADAEWQAAEARLAILGQIEKAEAEAIGRQYESPLEQRRRDVRETAANMGDAIENIELDAIDRLTDGLADASTEFIKLGGVAGDVLNSIIRDMVKLAAQKAIFGVGGGGPLGFLGGLLGGGSVLNAGSSGFDLSFGGARAGGGPVSAGKTYLVGEKGPELFTAPSDGNIVPNGMIDTSAARSMTGMAASSPAQGVNGTIRVALTMDNDVFTARVQEASVPVAVEVVRQNSPGLIQAAKAETMRDMGRPRL